MKNFLELPKEKWLHENSCFFIIKDNYPVSPNHLLIISKRLVKDYFDLMPHETQSLNRAISKARKLIERECVKCILRIPDGYNIGMNCGEAAGQTVMHFHCHVIPRYKGDMVDPRGGIRHCIPSKGNYL